jgi:hypothetical protein
MGMLAIKIPYPPPKTVSQWVKFHGLRSLEKAVDFPERHLSYVIAGCKEADWERCALEVRTAVSLHSRGTEPSRLEIRFRDPN